MEGILQFFLENWGNTQGWIKILISLAIFLSILSALFNRFLPLADFFEKKRKKRNEMKEKFKGDVDDLKLSLKNHQFFDYMSHLLKYKIKTIDLDNNARNYIILEKLIPLKIEKFSKAFFDLIDSEVDFEEMKSSEIKKYFVQKLYKATEDYEKEFLDLGNTAEEKEVAKFILDRFNEFDLVNGSLAISMINDIFDSSVYLSNVSKFNSSLYILIMPFELLFSSAEKTFKNLNGQIAKKSFHGRVF